jgi:hypothetical protein
MIETLISSKTRVKLLLKFFLNSSTKSYLRGLESEFGESSNGIRIELNRFTEAGMLKTSIEGNKKFFTANTSHPLYGSIHSLIRQYVGIDTIIENVVVRLGDVEKVFLTGEFAKGLDNPVIDIILIGKVDKNYLLNLVEKAEKIIGKKIRYMSFSPSEWKAYKKQLRTDHALLLWQKDDQQIT